jgi:hypothetical protein
MRPVVLFVAFAALTPWAAAYDPTDKYEKREVRGFAVLVNPAVLAHPAEAKAAFAELDAQLRKLAAVVPEKPLAALKKIRIWVEWEAKKNGAAEFHHSAGWLKENGYNPDKLDAVEINNARNFVAWSRKAQPWMVMHELAHGYHFTALGERHAPLRAAYEQARERKLYDEVDRVGGKKQRAYALTNPAEYFAELTEAYFGKNDFYPFTRDELMKHDPVGFELMKTAWGTPRAGDQ